jgi:cell division initiation protein
MNRDKVISEILGGETVMSPSDIVNRDFRRKFFGGYESREVDAYLGRIADVLEMTARQVRDLKAQLEDYKAKLDEYRQVEETLRNALVTSQKFGENLIESARREAETLLESAKIERRRIEVEASKLPVALVQEISQLEEQRNRLRFEITSILAAHRDLLDSIPLADGNGRHKTAGAAENANNSGASQPFPPLAESQEKD